jgi:hypothetical protein
MNDSGFWIYCKMGALTDREALRSWTVLLIVLGVTAMVVTVLFAALLPMPARAASQAKDAMGIERLDPALDRLVDSTATIEILAEGYEWSEGPVWVKDGGFVLFSDVPKNVVHRWKEGEGAKPYLTPSGYTGSEPRGGETGSNGLTLDREGRLVLAQHGDRRVARMDAPVSAPRPAFTSLADRFEGKRFNSPNDLVFHSTGDLYFTDPAYGMERQWDDPRREMAYAGVFRRSAAGDVTLLTQEMTRPNGLAFSPDETRLYVVAVGCHGGHPARLRRESRRHARQQPRLLRRDADDEDAQRFARRPQGGRGRQPLGHRARRRARHLTRGQTSRHDPDGSGDGELRLRRRRPDALHHGRHVFDARAAQDEGDGFLTVWLLRR